MRDKFALGSMTWLCLLVLVVIALPLIVSVDATSQDIRARLLPPAWVSEGTSAHLLGTDTLGRDLLSRLVYGGRVSLSVGLVAVAGAATFGTLIGLSSGSLGGRADMVLMRVVDLQCSFPGMLLALVIISVLGAGLRNLVIVLVINNWAIYARMVRGMILTIMQRDYIEAARVVGCGNRRIVFRHVLPQVVSQLTTLITLELAGMILAEAGLSFLGLGIQPPDSSWGLIIADGRQYLSNAWWLVTFPGMAITLTVISINLLANWLREVSDPLQRQGFRGDLL